LGLWIALLLIRSNKYKNENNSLSIIHTQNELLKKEFERLELTENLKETTEEFTASILTIKKVALLKKQLENIVDEKSPNYNEKDTLKKLKVCLNSFFDNYKELSQIMQKKLSVDKIVNFIKKDHPDITDKEIKVIEYITLNFTSKEIALLMDKSEKSVEYYRTQIRKKIKLNSSSTLEEYLNSRLM
jgi:DNA-binding CsgD family transcriptional regulator